MHLAWELEGVGTWMRKDNFLVLVIQLHFQQRFRRRTRTTNIYQVRIALGTIIKLRGLALGEMYILFASPVASLHVSRRTAWISSS